jgi:hypothetical protein
MRNSVRAGEVSMDRTGREGLKGFFAAGRKWRLAEAKTAPEAKTATRGDRRMAAGCILNGIPPSKIEIPVHGFGGRNHS